VRITLLAIGKARGTVAELYADYAKRLNPAVHLRELEIKPATAEKECAALLVALPPKAVLVACDERGKNMGSTQLAAFIQKHADTGAADLAFVLGGADGLTDDLRSRASLLLSFGQLTWPHMLARVMLIEQIYRAQQINAGHPYHRGN
jgi:23S rRNA (pseudouridine1915-N3)-methyltransferase